MNDVDRVRRELGLQTAPDSAAGAERLERFDLRDVIGRSASKSEVPVMGLGLLRTLSWVALAAAAVTACLHRGVWSWVASLDQNVVSGAARTVLDVGHAPLWVPWAAGVTAAGLLSLAILTRGFTRADRNQILAMTVLDIAAMAMAVPLALALAIGAAFIAAVVAIGIVLLVIAGAVLLAGDS